MVQNSLTGRRIVIFSTLGFEKVEHVAVRDALLAAGATVHVLWPEGPTIRAFEVPEWAGEVAVDRTLAEARADDYGGLYPPGGIINPHLLRLDARAIALVRGSGNQGKPIGAMCHGPWFLIWAGLAKNPRIAAWPSLKWDLENAGATYVDEPVVRDGPLVTARNPDDIPQLNSALVEHFGAPARAGAAE